MDSGETRGHQRDKTPSGAVENVRRLGLFTPRDRVPSPSRRKAARCWPPAGLRGGQRECIACSMDCVWSLAIAGVQGTGAYPRLSRPVPGPRGGRGHTCRTPLAYSVSNATSRSVSAKLARCRRTKCNRGCGTCVVAGSHPLLAAVQRRPRK